MDFAELEAKATEQREIRANAFRKHLAEERERESKNTGKVQHLLSKLRKRIEAETQET